MIRRRRGATWTLDAHDLALALGPAFDTTRYLWADRRARREFMAALERAWRMHGEDAVATMIVERPGSRPWGWWFFVHKTELPMPDEEVGLLLGLRVMSDAEMDDVIAAGVEAADAQAAGDVAHLIAPRPVLDANAVLEHLGRPPIPFVDWTAQHPDAPLTGAAD